MGCPASDTPKHKERSFIENVGFYLVRTMVFLLSMIFIPLIAVAGVFILFNTIVLENGVNIKKLTNMVNKSGENKNNADPDLDINELELVD